MTKVGFIGAGDISLLHAEGVAAGTQATQRQCPADGHLSNVRKAAAGWLLPQSVGFDQTPKSPVKPKTGPST